MNRLSSRHLLSLLFLPALAASVAAQQSPAGGWRLVYAVDSAGRPTQGEKAGLLAAIRAGQPVRVGWGLTWRLQDGTTGRLEHAAEASFLTIHQGEVFAQLAPILGQTPSAREPVVSFRTEGSQLWYGLLDTTGRLLSYFSGGSPPQTVRLATYWYVQAGT
jgi:hypothetical protein